MKDIGEKLQEARERTGITIEEAAEDLNYKVSQLEDIETGNYRTFKDKFILKTIITDYAKYLGLEVEKIIDEFNDYVFESTSKIPIDDITKASKMKEVDTDDKIASPYTVVEEDNKGLKVILTVLIIILIAAIALFVYNQFIKDKGSSSFEVSYVEETII